MQKILIAVQLFPERPQYYIIFRAAAPLYRKLALHIRNPSAGRCPVC
jgi:hypothetical protein